MRTLEALLAAHTVRDGDCLLWTGPRAHGGWGHGRLYVDDRDEPAHRAVWRARWGEPPARIYRTCSRPTCLEPTHLTANRVTKPWVRYRYLAGPQQKRS